MIISKMKPNTFILEEVLKSLLQENDLNSECNEVKLENLDMIIKIYNLNSIFYISLETFEDLLWKFLKIRKSEYIRNFIREMINIYKIDQEEINEKELCRVDHLNENILILICRKYTEMTQMEDASMFQKIEMSVNKNSIEHKYPFEEVYPQKDFSNILNNIYNSNSFINENTNEKVDILYKKHFGRGRHVKQVNVKDRPFICEYLECKRAFKRFEHLKRHNKMHTGERPYKCKFPGCMKAFSRSDNLAQHFKIHNVPMKSQSLTFRHYYETNKHLE